MATARFGMTLNEVTTSLLDRNANEANNFQLIDNLAMMLTKNNTLSDGKYIATDKIRARDGDGLYLVNDGGDGVFMRDDGDIWVEPTDSLILRKNTSLNPSTGPKIDFYCTTETISSMLNSANPDPAVRIAGIRTDGGMLGALVISCRENIGGDRFGLVELLRIKGSDRQAYFTDNVSAASFTDRCNFPEGIDAIAAIRPIKGDGNGRLDHATLPECVRVQTPKDIFEERDVLDEKGNPKLDKTGQKITERIKVGEEIEEGRDLGAMVSVLTKGFQELEAIVKAQAVEIAALKKVAAIST